MTERSDDGLRVSPVVANRHLLRHFVQARRDAGFASRELAAEALRWSARKQALLESGDQPIPVKDLDVILSVFGVPEPERARWYEQAELARAKAWWDSYDEADLSAEGKRFVGYEWGARRIRSFDGSIMPALLQIPGYTAAALAAGVGDRPPEQINRLLAVRRQRQRALGQPDPLEYEVVLDEAALRRPGGDRETMRAQLSHVLDLSETRPNIRVQVVPFSAGLYPAQSGTFVIMEFGESDDDPGLVHVEPGFTGSLYMEERNEIYLYSRVFQRLLEIALSPAESMDLIRSVISDTQPRARRRAAV
jgi:hypothetical protein